jgi:hypothetical protein
MPVPLLPCTLRDHPHGASFPQGNNQRVFYPSITNILPAGAEVL